MRIRRVMLGNALITGRQPESVFDEEKAGPFPLRPADHRNERFEMSPDGVQERG
jgi:hypothetical protein